MIRLESSEPGFSSRTLVAKDKRIAISVEPVDSNHEPTVCDELLVTIGYTGNSSARKAVPLDNVVIPDILHAVNAYDPLVQLCKELLASGESFAGNTLEAYRKQLRQITRRKRRG